MTVHIVYDKQNGEILHTHYEFSVEEEAFIKLGKDEVLATLSDFFPEPEKVDVLALESEAEDLYRMRVNPTEKKLEPIPPSEER